MGLGTFWVLAAGLFVSPSPGQEVNDPANLRPQGQDGRVTRYEFWTVRERTMSGVGITGEHQTNGDRFETAGEITWVVDRVRSDGSSTCTMTIDWITATDIEDQVNDSRKGSGDTEHTHALLKAMAGAPLTYEVNADGTISEVSGVDRMRSNAQEADHVPEDLDFIESASDLATLVAAPAELAIGSSWKTDFKWTHHWGLLHQKMNYTLESVEQMEGIPIAFVSGQAKVKLEVDQSKLPPEGPSIDVKLRDGGVETQVWFDLNRGEAVGRNTKETRIIDVDFRHKQFRSESTTKETVQSQILRIAEE